MYISLIRIRSQPPRQVVVHFSIALVVFLLIVRSHARARRPFEIAYNMRRFNVITRGALDSVRTTERENVENHLA